VFACQHYVNQLAPPTSQRRGSVLPRSHRDNARKAFEKVTKTALPASHRELARAIEREEREYRDRIAALEEHARAIHALGVDYQSYPRPHAEVIVDTTTLVVLGGLGLDVSGETVPYVAGWGEDGALDAVTEFAQLIDDLARRVESALSAAGDTQATVATG
jgi:hypothetical protein